MNIRSPRFLGKRVIIERVIKWHVNDWRRRMAYITNSVDLVDLGAAAGLSAKFIGNGN